MWSLIKLEGTLVDAYEQAVGYLMVYVDDCLFQGPPEVVSVVETTLLRTWVCTTHQHISFKFPGALHDIGLTIEAWHDGFALHQKDYAQEFLEKCGMTESRGCTPIDAEEEEEEEVENTDALEPALADVRLAQRMGGGLIWVSSRTRPDVAYAVSRISSAAAKRPLWALRLGKQTLRYLAATRDFGLWYRSLGGGIGGFAGASFGVEVSQTGVTIYWKGMQCE